MNKLENKVTVVTGGNSGIGFGIAEAFSNHGALGTITGRNKEIHEITIYNITSWWNILCISIIYL